MPGLLDQTVQRDAIFPRLALRERSQKHPLVMFAAIVAAAFIWTLIPAGTTASAPGKAPMKTVHITSSTEKGPRLPRPNVEHACNGQNWGSESAECLKMIARESGKAEVAIRLIAAAAPTGLNTPNIY